MIIVNRSHVDVVIKNGKLTTSAPAKLEVVKEGERWEVCNPDGSESRGGNVNVRITGSSSGAAYNVNQRSGDVRDGVGNVCSLDGLGFGAAMIGGLVTSRVGGRPVTIGKRGSDVYVNEVNMTQAARRRGIELRMNSISTTSTAIVIDGHDVKQILDEEEGRAAPAIAAGGAAQAPASQPLDREIGCPVVRVQTHGTGEIAMHDSMASHFTAVAKKGTIHLRSRATVSQLTVLVEDMSSVYCNGLKAETALLVTCGMGGVFNVHVTRFASAIVKGMGSILGTREPEAVTHEIERGMGRVKFDVEERARAARAAPAKKAKKK